MSSSDTQPLLANNNNPAPANVVVTVPNVANVNRPVEVDQDAAAESSRLGTFLLATPYVLCFVLIRVVMPIYAGSTLKAGGDSYALLFYIALWFPVVLMTITILYKALWDRSTLLMPTVPWSAIFWIGLMSLMNGVCSAFAGLPNRTPPYLQGVLQTMRIPFTVIVRLVMLRKGISKRRLGCTVAAMIGVFITIEPQIWSLPGSDSSSGGGHVSSAGHVVFPVLFGLGFLFTAISSVLCERHLQQRNAQSLSCITWSQVFQLLIIVPLFWVDILPFFGMADSMEAFGRQFKRGMECNVSSAEDCEGLAFKGWIFILAFCLGNLFQFLLIQKAEGAVLAVVVQSLVTPLATVFWSLFEYDEPTDRLWWQPQWNETTAFTLGGLAIAVPAVLLYNVFSQWDAREQREGR